MLRGFITCIMIILFYILQCTVFNSLSLASVSPNLMIILTFAIGFMRGTKAGITTGFFCGLLIDCFSGSVLGFNALIFMYIGYFNGIFHRLFYDEDVTLPLCLVVGSDFVYLFSFYVIRFVLRNRLNFGEYFTKIMLPEMLYTVIIAILIYRLLLKGNRFLEAREKRSEAGFD